MCHYGLGPGAALKWSGLRSDWATQPSLYLGRALSARRPADSHLPAAIQRHCVCCGCRYGPTFKSPGILLVTRRHHRCSARRQATPKMLSS